MERWMDPLSIDHFLWIHLSESTRTVMHISVSSQQQKANNKITAQRINT